MSSFESTFPASETFINPNGVLCRTVWLFDKPRYTMLNIFIKYHGINEHINEISDEGNYWWEARELEIKTKH